MGALLVWVVAMVAYVGYNAFNGALAAQAVRQLARSHAPPDRETIVGFSLLAMAMAAIGYDWIHHLQRVVAYCLLALLAVFTLGALWFIDVPRELLRPGDFRTIPFLVQFFAAAAYQLSWSIYVSDYSRYLPPKVGVVASFAWTYVGALVGGVWMMLVGTYAAALYPHADVAGAVQHAANALAPGFGSWLLGGALLGLMAISALNFYGASLTLLSVADCFRPQRAGVGRRLVALAIAAIPSIAIALEASKDFVTRFSDLLAVLLYLFTPWTAINLVDFYWVRKCHYSVREIFNPRGIYGRWSWRGLVAYGGGFAAMIPFFSTGMYVGPVARALGGADLAMLVGLPVSSVIYLLACRSLDIEREWELAALADRDLEPGGAGLTPGAGLSPGAIP